MTKRKKAYIGIDIGKKRCGTSCVIDEKGRVLERGQYCNTAARAASYAKDVAARYDVHSAACETTGNMWTRTFGAFEDAGILVRSKIYSRWCRTCRGSLFPIRRNNHSFVPYGYRIRVCSAWPGIRDLPSSVPRSHLPDGQARLRAPIFSSAGDVPPVSGVEKHLDFMEH